MIKLSEDEKKFMSKYKVGDKFIIEINEVMESDNGTLYRADFSTLVFDDYGLDNLPQLVGAVNEARYNKGFADAWEAARMIYENPDRIREIFDNPFVDDILNSHAPQAIVAKIKAYEDRKEIRRGDEMVHVMDSNAKMIVIYIATDGDFIHGLNRTGDVYSCTDPANWRKTGRNFADRLDALLEEIGNG